MKMTPAMMAEMEADGGVDEAEESAELKKLADIEEAIAMQGRVMQQMISEIQSGLQKKCQYKFTVKRDENKMITEIIAIPMEGA